MAQRGTRSTTSPGRGRGRGRGGRAGGTRARTTKDWFDWTAEKAQTAEEKGYYIKITPPNVGKTGNIYITGAEQAWEKGEDRTYVPELRIVGKDQDIADFLGVLVDRGKITEQRANEYLMNAYTAESTGAEGAIRQDYLAEVENRNRALKRRAEEAPEMGALSLVNAVKVYEITNNIKPKEPKAVAEPVDLPAGGTKKGNLLVQRILRYLDTNVDQAESKQSIIDVTDLKPDLTKAPRYTPKKIREMGLVHVEGLPVAAAPNAEDKYATVLDQLVLFGRLSPEDREGFLQDFRAASGRRGSRQPSPRRGGSRQGSPRRGGRMVVTTPQSPREASTLETTVPQE